MSVETIDNLRGFEHLRDAWDEVYRRDPKANVFRSWPWLAGWLEATTHPWLVLAVRRADGPYLGFLALSVRSQPGRWGLGGGEVLRLAGHPITNHTGLLALPEVESEVVGALADALERRSWRALSFELTSDARLGALVGALERGGMRVKQHTDNESPYLALPKTFEGYLEATLSGKARRELRRRQRKVASRGLRFSQLEPGGDLERYLGAFLELHQQRFGPLAARHERMYHHIFGRMQGSGLHFQLLSDGARPVAAQVGFVDHKNRVYHGCQGGWDAEYGELAPGLLIKLEAIRYATARGLVGFDLGRGKDSYKQALGGVRVETQRLRLARPGLRQRLRRTFVRSAVELER